VTGASTGVETDEFDGVDDMVGSDDIIDDIDDEGIDKSDEVDDSIGVDIDVTDDITDEIDDFIGVLVQNPTKRQIITQSKVARI
jgi:hypothetical protein